MKTDAILEQARRALARVDEAETARLREKLARLEALAAYFRKDGAPGPSGRPAPVPVPEDVLVAAIAGVLRDEGEMKPALISVRLAARGVRGLPGQVMAALAGNPDRFRVSRDCWSLKSAACEAD